ncbi:MAG: hypothetical protein ACM339_06010 [Ignavibacteria bacterium]
MDDFIQILIYLIIIISFLSSVFKKKEKKEPSQSIPQRRPQPGIPDAYETAKTNEDETDIFREISDLFKAELPQKPDPDRRKTTIEQRSESVPTSSEHSSEEYKKTESEHVSYEREKSSIEHSPTYSEHNLDLSWHQPTEWIKKKKPKIDASIEKRADSFKKLLEKKRTETNIYNFKIRDTLKNPQSLKEYILVSEIIGRPKALKK